MAGSPHGAVAHGTVGPHGAAPPEAGTSVPGNTAGLPQLGLLVITGAGAGRLLAAVCTAAESG